MLTTILSKPDSIIKTDTGHIEFRGNDIKVVEYKYCLYCDEQLTAYNRKFCNVGHQRKYQAQFIKKKKVIKKITLTKAQRRLKKYIENPDKYTLHYNKTNYIVKDNNNNICDCLKKITIQTGFKKLYKQKMEFLK